MTQSWERTVLEVEMVSGYDYVSLYTYMKYSRIKKINIKEKCLGIREAYLQVISMLAFSEMCRS